MIEVKKIHNKGRGIIATQHIPKGTLLEVAPVEAFQFEQKQSINETEVFKYYFVKPSEYSKSKDVKRYLIFGLASLCNHEKKPNARVEWIEDEIGLWSHLIAQKDINKGEEVTLFYTNIDEYINAYKFV
ncbi:SET domain-containing protein-lysine N-methyltransferase [Microcoleus sp.]|uniref:SET domain-containing protein-lysine N-methyltransferase n=1 Tax=Microcoleus sp. TaxID=44472 RepID=UPI003593B0A7